MRNVPPRILQFEQRTAVKQKALSLRDDVPKEQPLVVPAAPVSLGIGSSESEASIFLTLNEHKESTALAMLEYKELTNAWKTFRLQTENNQFLKIEPGTKNQIAQMDIYLSQLGKTLFAPKTDKWWIDLSDTEKEKLKGKRSQFFVQFLQINPED